MTRQERIAARIKAITEATPHSITTTDNPIFKTLIPLHCLSKTGDVGGDEFVDIPQGTLVRILDCDLDESGLTMTRYNPTPTESYDFLINNNYLQYVSGNLGVRIEDDEEE